MRMFFMVSNIIFAIYGKDNACSRFLQAMQAISFVCAIGRRPKKQTLWLMVIL